MTPFPHTEDWAPPLDEQPEDYGETRWITGSLVLAEFGCGAFHRLVVNGPVTGEVWFDDQGSDGGVVRERNFYEWYMAWLDDPDKGFFADQAFGGGAPAVPVVAGFMLTALLCALLVGMVAGSPGGHAA